MKVVYRARKLLLVQWEARQGEEDIRLQQSWLTTLPLNTGDYIIIFNNRLLANI